MLTTSFIVQHQDEKIRDQLGFGFVVGEHHTKETISMNVEIVVDGQKTNAVKTIENTITQYKVLWDKARNVCPSVHAPNELEWVRLTEEYLADTYGDDEEEEGEEETGEGEEEEVVEVLDDNVLIMSDENKSSSLDQ